MGGKSSSNCTIVQTNVALRRTHSRDPKSRRILAQSYGKCLLIILSEGTVLCFRLGLILYGFFLVLWADTMHGGDSNMIDSFGGNMHGCCCW